MKNIASYYQKILAWLPLTPDLWFVKFYYRSWNWYYMLDDGVELPFLNMATIINNLQSSNTFVGLTWNETVAWNKTFTGLTVLAALAKMNVANSAITDPKHLITLDYLNQALWMLPVAASEWIKYAVANFTAVNAITWMVQDELAVDRATWNVYKYDWTNWNLFFNLQDWLNIISNSITYNNSTSWASATNVQDAIDELFDKCNRSFNSATTGPTANDDITNYDEWAIWIDTSTNPDTIYILSDETNWSAVWNQVFPVVWWTPTVTKVAARILSHRWYNQDGSWTVSYSHNLWAVPTLITTQSEHSWLWYDSYWKYEWWVNSCVHKYWISWWQKIDPVTGYCFAILTKAENDPTAEWVKARITNVNATTLTVEYTKINWTADFVYPIIFDLYK